MSITLEEKVVEAEQEFEKIRASVPSTDVDPRSVDPALVAELVARSEALKRRLAELLVEIVGSRGDG